MTLSSSSRGERKSNQNLASFMGAPRSIVVCVLVLHMHDHFTVKLDNLPESSDARASPRFESIFFRMTGRFNGPFVEILVSAIIGERSWLLGTYVWLNFSPMSPKLLLTYPHREEDWGIAMASLFLRLILLNLSQLDFFTKCLTILFVLIYSELKVLRVQQKRRTFWFCCGKNVNFLKYIICD